MAQRYQCPLLTPTCLHASVLSRKVGVLGMAGGPGRLGQRPAEPAITLGSSAATGFAGASVVAGADAGPRRQMAGCRKDAHVSPQLGDKYLGRAAIDTRDRDQAIDCLS